MQKIIVHRAGAAPTGATGTDRNFSGTTIKLGLDIHQACYVVAAQEEHATPNRAPLPARRVRALGGDASRARHRVFIVYEACGFGFGLCRRLQSLGATCYVIAPRKLDEARKGVKTDALDAGVLCQRLSRYVDGNRKELAVIRVPTEEEERARHVHRQREALVRARTKLQAQGRGLLVTHGQPARPIGGGSKGGLRSKSFCPTGCSPAWKSSGRCSRCSTCRSPRSASGWKRPRSKNCPRLGKLTKSSSAAKSATGSVSRTAGKSAAIPGCAPANTAAAANG